MDFLEIMMGARYLVSFGSGKHDAIYKRIKYLISQKSGITYVFSHHYAKMKIKSYHSSPLKKHWLFVML